MTSFVDTMANHIWSDADITRRTEAMIRSEFSVENEHILNRKVLAASVGAYTLTEEEQQEVERYTNVTMNARVAGVAAREDMQLLLKAFPIEEAQQRLNRPQLSVAWDRFQQPVVEQELDPSTGEVMNASEVEQDQIERKAAEDIISPYLTEVNGQLTLDLSVIANDDNEREAAQSLIDGADENVLDLFNMRKVNSPSF